MVVFLWLMLAEKPKVKQAMLRCKDSIRPFDVVLF